MVQRAVMIWISLLFVGTCTYVCLSGILTHQRTFNTPTIKGQDYDLDTSSNPVQPRSLWSGREGIDVNAQRETLAPYDPVKVNGQGPVEMKMNVKVKPSETLPVQRDIRVQEPWPEVQRGEDPPNQAVFDTAHWLWCGAKKLEIRHYLSVLSAFRILQPLKLIMHYTDMPKIDSYNTWFNELNDSLPNLELKQLVINVSCESSHTWRYALEILSPTGGVFMGENVILTRFPDEARNSTIWFAVPDAEPNSAINGVVFASKPFDPAAKEASMQILMTSRNNGCKTIEAYDNQTTSGPLRPHCIFTAKRVIFPRDFMHLDTQFGELARWLFYGRRAVIRVEKEGTSIPRISHIIRIVTGKPLYGKEMAFSHFISVLSALYMAGFQRVFLHADVEPEGPLWRHLVEKENVTCVPLVKPESVYQQPIRVPAHVSDIARYLLLYKYGGAYQDWDVLWTQYLSDSYLSQPAIIGYDHKSFDWVDNASNGVMLTRARTHWMHHFLATHRDFRDDIWRYNSLMMSYRTWELYPWTVLLDRHLQVVCHSTTCFPTWTNTHKYSGKDAEPLSVLNSTYALHVTTPDPPVSLASLEKLRARADVLAVLGKIILEKSGRKSWLDPNFTLPADF